MPASQFVLRAPIPACLLCFVFALAPTTVRAGDQIAPEVLKKTKKATVYLRVTLTGDRVVEGSGFFGGAKNVVITNRHVLGMLSADGRPPQKIEVIVDSGEPTEKKHVGELLQVDPQADLAAIHVPGNDLPPPLTFGEGKGLVETQTLYIFGFPFGKRLGRNITVSKTNVSSLRTDANGILKDIQVNGGMHPGNSGGPVIDASGKAVGVSVAGISGTQINFAIPAETVRNFLVGRKQGWRVLSPYQQEAVKKMPVLFNMVDPLNVIEKVYVEAWVGKPGPDRKAVNKIGVEPQPEDSAKEKYELVYKDRTANGDIVLPTIPKGQVLWMQVSYKRRGGATTWTAAISHPADKLLVVERKPTTLAFEHRPDNPCKLTLTATTDLKLHAVDGGDGHFVIEIKAEMIERQMEKASKDGAAPILLTFNSLSVKQTLDKEDILDKEVANNLKSAKAVMALAHVDRQGELAIRKLAINVASKDVQQDLAVFGVQVLQFLEAVTVPLPGLEVSHEKPWKNKREISLGSGRSAEPAVVDLVYTLHGVRDTAKRKEAVVFIQGDVRGQKGAGLAASGKMSGQAVVDLKTSQIRFADVTLNIDLDLPSARGESLQANGTLKIALVRTPLTGKELEDTLKQKAVFIETPSAPPTAPKTVAKAAPKKKGAVDVPVRPIPGDVFAFLKQAVSEDNLAPLEEKGFTLGKNTYRDAHEAGGILIGFQAGLGKFNSDIGALRPIYLTKNGEKMGQWIGPPPTKIITLKAKEGYAVHAVSLRSTISLQGFSLTFAKLDKGTLDSGNTYDSEWFGGMVGTQHRIGGRDHLFTGVFGHMGNNKGPCSIGLLTPLVPAD